MSLEMFICLLVLYETSGLTHGLTVSMAQSTLFVTEGSRTTLTCIVAEADDYRLAVNWYKCRKHGNNCAIESRVGGEGCIWGKKEYSSSSQDGKLIWKTDGKVFNLTFTNALKGTEGNYCCLAETWYYMAWGPMWRYHVQKNAIVELIVTDTPVTGDVFSTDSTTDTTTGYEGSNGVSAGRNCVLKAWFMGGAAVGLLLASVFGLVTLKLKPPPWVQR